MPATDTTYKQVDSIEAGSGSSALDSNQTYTRLQDQCPFSIRTHLLLLSPAQTKNKNKKVNVSKSIDTTVCKTD